MYDMIIRNGNIIDGTGKDRFKADIAIKDGRISEIGEIPETANKEIDAENIANKIKKITKQNNPVVKKVKYPNNYPSDEPRRRCPSIEEFCKEFKFRPKISLNEGLKMFFEYAKKNY